jgi:hypothetical protein
MRLESNGGHYGPVKHILVIFNAASQQVTFVDASLQGASFGAAPDTAKLQ